MGSFMGRIALMFIILFLSGCGVSHKEHEDAMAELKLLRAQAKELSATVSAFEEARSTELAAAEQQRIGIQAKLDRAVEANKELKSEKAVLEQKIQEVEDAKLSLELTMDKPKKKKE